MKTVVYDKEYRAGKIWFSGEQNSMLLKARSGARCAPHNFVLIVTLQSTSVCLVPHRAPNEIDYIKTNV